MFCCRLGEYSDEMLRDDVIQLARPDPEITNIQRQIDVAKMEALDEARHDGIVLFLTLLLLSLTIGARRESITFTGCKIVHKMSQSVIFFYFRPIYKVSVTNVPRNCRSTSTPCMEVRRRLTGPPV